MASKAQKLKDKDSFSVFNDSQHEEELKAKEQSSIETQTTLSFDISENTDLTFNPKSDKSTDPELHYYTQATEFHNNRRKNFKQAGDDCKERAFINKQQNAELKEQYAALFATLADKLEDKSDEAE